MTHERAPGEITCVPALSGLPFIVFRADSGFFVGVLLDLLNASVHGYLIKVKRQNLTQLLAQHRWTPIRHQPGWEQCEI